MATGNISGRRKAAAGRNVKERDYWLNKLAGDPVKSFFPYDYTETAGKKPGPGTGGDIVKFTLRGELFSRLTKLGGGSDNRLHMVLVTALTILLEKYTGNKDIIVGTPIYRQAAAGEFINTVLALRNEIEPGITFKGLLLKVRETIFAAVENQNYPIEALLYKLNLTVTGQDFPLFDAALLLENIHDKKYLEHIHCGMIFCFSRTAESIEGELEYNPARYKKATAARITAHFQRLFETVLFNLDTPVSAVDILPAKEKKQILADFNDTAKEYPQDKTIPRLLETRLEKCPDGTAVVFEDKYLTYRGLDGWANRLARLLREKGVARDGIVPVILEPAPGMIVAIIAVVKAGGAYLPIDPDYPGKRISAILQTGDFSILLTNVRKENRDKIPADKPGGDIIFLDDIPGRLAGCPEDKPDHINRPGDLLYLISTSGSTGVPKSPMIEHRNLVNLLNFQFHETAIEFSRVLQFASIGFDVSVQEIFSTLLSGGELYLIDKDMKSDIMRLFQLIRRNHINVVFWPPAFLKSIFSEPEYYTQFPSSIGHMITAGEQLIVPEPLRGYLRAHHVYLHNHYGPSETHVVTAYTIDPGGEIPEMPPIGKPISNTKIYILDENKNPKPLGIAGELYISGAGVGRGYYKREEQTAEKFSDNPFVPGQRMYRTGDLARWLPGGNIEFIGRVDFQVKIRGFRVELGEIETHLMDIDFIKEAVVVDIEDLNGEKYLCGYIVSESELNTAELADILADRLPGYMVPPYFVRLEKIPLTANGKLDRKALPLPAFGAGRDRGYIAPKSAGEKKMAEIWADVLGMEKDKIGIKSDFFELGGHSLKATILITKIHKAFNVKVTLGEMFKQPTVSGLLEYVKESKTDIFASIAAGEKKEYYPLSSAQKRLYILQQMEPANTGYNNPLVVVLEGDIKKETFEKSFGKLVKRHETLRTSFAMLEDQPVQRVHDDTGFTVAYGEMGEEEAGVQAGRFRRPFDLGKAPLLRLGLIKTGVKHILMFDMHHIITDGTSLQVFLKEFMAFYGGGELPPLRIQYKDFSCWQNRLFQSGEIEKQQEYWLKQFGSGEDIPVSNLPADYARPALQSFEGDGVDFQLGSEETGALKELAKKENATLYMVLLAIYNLLLAKISGRQDIIVGTPTAGRRHADLQYIIGMFVNTMVMRNYPAGEKTFRAFLDEVRKRTLDAFENQDYQFEDLVDRLAINRDTSRNPLFDVMFALQNMEVQQGNIPVVEVPDLTMSQYNQRFKLSKFDLTLNVSEVGEGLACTFEYCTKLFKRETIERLAIYTREILFAILKDNGKRIWEIEIIPAEEKKQVLFDFNDTATAYPEGQTIAQLFLDQVEQTPDNIAVIGPHEGHEGVMSVTYRELDENSDRLARILMEKGAASDTIVGIIMERSVEMIAAVLGILKSGGAYLPIDPGYPGERIDYMLSDSGVGILLTGAAEIKAKETTDFPSPLTPPPPTPHLIGLYHLHLRFHGAAQGCRSGAPQCRQYAFVQKK